MTLDREERIRVLKQANERKTAKAVGRVTRAAESLLAEGAHVTINAVSSRAGVARSFIYKHPEVRTFLAGLQEASTSSLRTPQPKARASDASLRTRLADALDRNRDLALALEELKAEREVLLDQVRTLRAETRALRRGGLLHE